MLFRSRRESVIRLPSLAQIGSLRSSVAFLPLTWLTTPTEVAVAQFTISISFGCNGRTASAAPPPPVTIFSSSVSSSSTESRTGGVSPSRETTWPRRSSALVSEGSSGVGDKAQAVRNIKTREADAAQRSRLEFVKGMDTDFIKQIGGNNGVEAAVRNYEAAYRMQSAVPKLCDLSGETEATKKMYGMDSPNGVTAAYGHQALLARRLVESGVRFVELSCLPEKMGGGQAPNPWDQHGNLKGGHENMARQVDQPIGGLLKDLKGRGLLKDTLVIWAGEFGRTPF